MLGIEPPPFCEPTGRAGTANCEIGIENVQRLRHALTVKTKSLNRQKKTRITVDLNDESYARLAALKSACALPTHASVVREALHLYEYLVQQRDDGHTFWAKDEKGNEYPLPLFRPRLIKSVGKKRVPA